MNCHIGHGTFSKQIIRSLENTAWGVAHFLEILCNNDGLFLCCTWSDSIRKPKLSFHRLPLMKKKLLKVWVHKIGRKNLPLNNNTRVCSEDFVNAAKRSLRPDEYP